MNLRDNTRLPLIAAPMFLVSGPELVINTCRAGVIGTFPALNQRSSDDFEAWLRQVSEAVDPATMAPWGVNLIVHRTNPRLQPDLELCVKYKVPLIITSLGAVPDVVDAVHSYGGKVFHDVIKLRHAQKAAEAGVDGLIAVSAGAGGHAGTLSPFALVGEIRQFYAGNIILAGSLSTGGDLAAAIAMGADFGYMGTRFINTAESLAAPTYKNMINDCSADDIVYTDKISGVNANFLVPSLATAGVDLEKMAAGEESFASELDADKEMDAKAWKDIWSAGHGVGNIHDSPPVAGLIDQLSSEFDSAIQRMQACRGA